MVEHTHIYRYYWNGDLMRNIHECVHCGHIFGSEEQEGEPTNEQAENIGDGSGEQGSAESDGEGPGSKKTARKRGVS